MRRTVATCAAGFMAASVVTFTSAVPASAAADLDDELIAAQLCPAGAEFVDVESDDSSDRADVSLYIYATQDADDLLDQLCAFAIITTDDDSTLSGSYSVGAGATGQSGAISGTQTATTAVVTPAFGVAAATFAATGQQTTVEIEKVTSVKKRAAKKKYATAVKAAKKAYKKAGKTKKAKKLMTKRLALAKRKYRASVAAKTVVTKRPYALAVNLPVERPADLTPDLDE